MENAILVELSKRPYVRLWKNETGAVPLYKKNSDGSLYLDGAGEPVVERWIHYGKVGSGDLTGLVTIRSEPVIGVRLEIEVKTGSGRQSVDQVNFEKMITAQGGLYIVARDLVECCARVDDYAGWNK